MYGCLDVWVGAGVCGGHWRHVSRDRLNRDMLVLGRRSVQCSHRQRELDSEGLNLAFQVRRSSKLFEMRLDLQSACRRRRRLRAAITIHVFVLYGSEQADKQLHGSRGAGS